jgi:hypothetical protein
MTTPLYAIALKPYSLAWRKYFRTVLPSLTGMQSHSAGASKDMWASFSLWLTLTASAWNYCRGLKRKRRP